MFKKQKILTIKNGSFSENIEAFGVRCYAIDQAGVLPEPVRISVTTEIASKIATNGKSPQISQEDKVEKIRHGKNIVANPSYEEQTIRGIPDFHTSWRALKPWNLGEPDSEWFLDTENSWHGKYSLKLDRTMTHRKKSRYRNADMGAYLPPLTS